ncbi:MAG: DUF951 domain-containing protein [Dehalococcoidales bacterium]|nr:DUF951 domain-containing protein [Dehalococcoidales bacterium]
MDLKLGDIVRLKKKHPCGSNEWEVVRLGADIGLKCHRRMLISHAELERRGSDAPRRSKCWFACLPPMPWSIIVDKLPKF